MSNPDDLPLCAAELSIFVHLNRREIEGRWLESLNEISGTPGSPPHRDASGTDMLGFLARLADGVTITGKIVEEQIAEVREGRYSIRQMEAEIESLTLALELSGHTDPRSSSIRGAAAKEARSLLGHIFARVFGHATEAYQQVINTAHVPICLLSRSGRILFGNRAMEEALGTDVIFNIRLRDHLTILYGSWPEGITTELNIENAELRRVDGSTIRVAADIHPIRVHDELRTFVRLRDNARIVQREQRLFDRVGLAIIKLDEQLRIAYLNDAARDLIGAASDVVGLHVFDIFRQNDVTSEQLRRRSSGEADVYETEMVRRSDQKRIPISVAGTPILDNQGHYIGTIGIIRSLETEHAAARLHKLIDKAQDDRSILVGLAAEIGSLVPFDYFGINEHSRNGNYVSVCFSLGDAELENTGRRWWYVSSEQRSEYQAPFIVSDFPAFVRERRQIYVNDPSMKKYVDRAFQSMVRIPVTEARATLATVTLLSTHPAFYNHDHVRLLSKLPLVEAVQRAFYYKRLRQERAKYDLYRDMVKSRTSKDVAHLLAQALSSEYRWQHIAIYKVSESDRMFNLLAHVSLDLDPQAPAALQQQSITSGILGYVYQYRHAVNIPDIQSDPLSSLFVAGWGDTRSEMCIPIIWDDEVQWLLNVEDSRKAAFSDDECEDLSALLEEAALMLSRLSREYLLESAFQSSSDAVFVTDNQAEVVLVNPAAVRMLRYTSTSELKGEFKKLFCSEDAARRVFETTGHTDSEVNLLREDGSSLPVLISGDDLPDDLSRKVFLAKDLTLVQRVRQLEGLRRLFEEVALQTHTPLALVDTWLRRLRNNSRDDETRDMCLKSLAQLKNLEISYDRMALSFDSNGVENRFEPRAIDLGVEMKRVLADFPDSEAQKVKLSDPGELPYVFCDPLHLSFIFSTILAYLIRFGRSDEWVHIRYSCSATIAVSFDATIPPSPSSRSEEERLLARARFDFELGEPVIKRLIEKNKASYQLRSDESRTWIELTFPLQQDAN